MNELTHLLRIHHFTEYDLALSALSVNQAAIFAHGAACGLLICASRRSGPDLQPLGQILIEAASARALIEHAEQARLRELPVFNTDGQVSCGVSYQPPSDAGAGAARLTLHTTSGQTLHVRAGTVLLTWLGSALDETPIDLTVAQALLGVEAPYFTGNGENLQWTWREFCDQHLFTGHNDAPEPLGQAPQMTLAGLNADERRARLQQIEQYEAAQARERERRTEVSRRMRLIEGYFSPLLRVKYRTPEALHRLVYDRAYSQSHSGGYGDIEETYSELLDFAKALKGLTY